MKNAFVITLFLALSSVSFSASAAYVVGCSHWDSPAITDHVYNYCEVTITSEPIVVGVTQIAIDSQWESDVYFDAGGPYDIGAFFDEDIIEPYPGPFVTGSTVDDWADLTDVYTRVQSGTSVLNHIQYCWESNFLYFVTGSGWQTNTTDMNCKTTNGFTF